MQLGPKLPVVTRSPDLLYFKLDIFILPMSPLYNLALVVGIDLDYLFQVILLTQHLANDEFSGGFIAFIEINSSDQRFKCITVNGFVGLPAFFIGDFRFLLAIFKIYWRKINFIGDNELFIGENQILLATWKFSLIFSS